jgi:hypothetical protein
MSLDAASSFPGNGVAMTTADDAAAVRRCTACGYDLRGLVELRCPECGLAFDPDFLPIANIPWLKRGNLALNENASGGNAVVAYWRTVWLVLAQPRKFGEMVWQDVEVDAAETTRFRCVTIGIAVGSLLATLLPMLGRASLGAIVALVMLAGLLLGFFAIATAPFNLIQFVSWRFLDEERYRRLHDLSCAGLALAPIVPIILLLGSILGWPSYDTGRSAVALCGVVVAAWWYGSLRYAIHGGRCRRGDAILHALMLPFAWFMIAMVIVVFGLGITGLVAGLLR